jgi:hypothetical protein
MAWHEVDLDKALWTIPAERVKGDAAHEVPLAQESELIGPRFVPAGKGHAPSTMRAGYLFPSRIPGAWPVIERPSIRCGGERSRRIAGAHVL